MTTACSTGSEGRPPRERARKLSELQIGAYRLSPSVWADRELKPGSALISTNGSGNWCPPREEAGNAC